MFAYVFFRFKRPIAVFVYMFIQSILVAQHVEVPGKDKFAQIKEDGISVLPSGRFVKPAGELKLITRAPYGLAISNDEKQRLYCIATPYRWWI